MPQLAQIANLWTLVGHPSKRREWSLDAKVAAIAAAGFDGLADRLTATHRRLADKYGLPHLLGFFATDNATEFESLLRGQMIGGATHINVHLGRHDTPPDLAAKQWLQLVRSAGRIGGLVASLEVHRGTCTETAEKTYEIAARYHEATGELIKLNFDFSHIASCKHLEPSNYAARLLDHPALVRHSEQIHLRPFNGHHCQVPVTVHGRLTPECRSYLKFAAAVLGLWKKAPGNRAKTLFVCPEMGPYAPGGAGYNLSGLPPAWPEAVRLRKEIADLWQSC